MAIAGSALVLCIAPRASAEPLAAGAAPASTVLDEASGAERVCTAGPAAALARAARLRGAAAMTAASVLPNPEVALEHERILTGDDGHETTVGIGVPVVISGRRSLLRDAASARSAAARAEAEETLFEQALSFRETYARAAIERSRVDVLDEQQRALEGLAETIRALAKGGEVAGFDLLRQQHQARVHRRRLEMTKARAASSERLLEAWTGAPVRTPRADLGSLSGGHGLGARAGKAARTAPARVRSLEAQARALALEARAARRRSVPDVGVFVGYRTVTASAGSSSQTGHGFRVGLSVPLPLFDHGQGEAAHAETEQSIALAAASQVAREHAARSHAALDRLERLERGIIEADSTVREAGVLRSKARQLYAAGELSISELLDAYRSAEEAQLARVDLAEEIAAARLALMRARGTQFDARLDVACGRTP